MPKLTNKQKMFIDEYLVDLNATQACIRAGYSKKTAAEIGKENLMKPYIAAEVEKRMKDREERTEITQDKVLNELAKIAFTDDPDKCNSEMKIKVSDKLKALELAGRHLKMFTDKMEISEEEKSIREMTDEQLLEILQKNKN